MKLGKSKIFYIKVSTILLLVYTILSIGLPFWIESHSEENFGFEERVDALEMYREKIESDESIDKSSLMNIFEILINGENSQHKLQTSYFRLFKTFSQISIGLLIIHLIAIYLVIKESKA